MRKSKSEMDEKPINNDSDYILKLILNRAKVEQEEFSYKRYFSYNARGKEHKPNPDGSKKLK